MHNGRFSEWNKFGVAYPEEAGERDHSVWCNHSGVLHRIRNKSLSQIEQMELELLKAALGGSRSYGAFEALT